MNQAEREKRQHQRLILSAPLYVRTLDGERRFSGQCDSLDVSPRGTLLRIPCELSAGTRLRLDITHSDRTAEGRVVHCERDGSRWWKVRVRLLRADPHFCGVMQMPLDWDSTSMDDDRVWLG